MDCEASSLQIGIAQKGVHPLFWVPSANELGKEMHRVLGEDLASAG